MDPHLPLASSFHCQGEDGGDGPSYLWDFSLRIIRCAKPAPDPPSQLDAREPHRPEMRQLPGPTLSLPVTADYGRTFDKVAKRSNGPAPAPRPIPPVIRKLPDAFPVSRPAAKYRPSARQAPCARRSRLSAARPYKQ